MKNSKLSYFMWVLILSVSFPVFADNNLWQDVKSLQQKDSFGASKSYPYKKARLLNLNRINMSFALEAKASEKLSYRFATVNSSRNIALPLPDGTMLEVELVHENLLESSLKTSFPSVKTYRILPSARVILGAVDMTPQGFHAMLQMNSGKTIFIDPIEKNAVNSSYVSYYKKDQIQGRNSRFSCGASSAESINDMHLAEQAMGLKQPELQSTSVKHEIINYRIAIAATGEYTAKQGGTVIGAMSAIITTLNRINQVYEQGLGVHLSLVANNEAIIYTNAISDPYYAKDKDELLQQNQANIDAVIGSGNYDIGHLFTTSGGGLASIGSVCKQKKKAHGVSGISNPVNDSFNLDFVAHELGHQLGATHTFNGGQGLCSGRTRTSKTAFEPGSGSSLMSYAGYCGSDNIQSKTDAMFHIGSIKQIRALAQKSAGSCGTIRQSYNRPPSVNAGRDYTIPARTAFELRGNASDPESDSLVYSWQQLDAGKRSFLNEDHGDNALFRLYMPSSNSSRSFPSLKSLLTHQTIRGEKLPEKKRDLHFNFVAQDGENVAQSDEMQVKVFPTGSRFSLYLPHSQYSRGDTHKILWNVADTDKSPINCQSVDIYLSVNRDYDFSTQLARNVANTGEAWVTIASTTSLSTSGRFKIKCSDNIFYAVSYRDFHIAEQGTTGNFLSDQDQPEPNVGKPNTGNGGSVDQPSKSAAGSTDWFVMWMLLMLASLRLFSRKHRKI